MTAQPIDAPRTPRARITAELEAIAAEHGYTLGELTQLWGPRDRRQARVACYRYLRSLGWGVVKIGKLFGRDHSSVIHALAEGTRREAYLERMKANTRSRRARAKKRTTDDPGAIAGTSREGAGP